MLSIFDSCLGFFYPTKQNSVTKRNEFEISNLIRTKALDRVASMAENDVLLSTISTRMIAIFIFIIDYIFLLDAKDQNRVPNPFSLQITQNTTSNECNVTNSN